MVGAPKGGVFGVWVLQADVEVIGIAVTVKQADKVGAGAACVLNNGGEIDGVFVIGVWVFKLVRPFVVVGCADLVGGKRLGNPKILPIGFVGKAIKVCQHFAVKGFGAGGEGVGVFGDVVIQAVDGFFVIAGCPRKVVFWAGLKHGVKCDAGEVVGKRCACYAAGIAAQRVDAGEYFGMQGHGVSLLMKAKAF